MLEREKETRQIVFFDGVCHLCNGFTDFAIQNETPPKKLFFAPLQGSTAQNILPEKDRMEIQSLLYWDGKDLHKESEAVLKVFSQLRFPWNFLAQMAKALPIDFRNSIYRWVARNRYAWFGQRESCRLPLPTEKSQLLP
jgi:predicted DCC family thiol-disulfide oxidoreductase YuxK